MGEFTFDGGHRDGPSFHKHLEERQAGLPRVNPSPFLEGRTPVPLPRESAASAFGSRPKDDQGFSRDYDPLAHNRIPARSPKATNSLTGESTNAPRSPQDDLEDLCEPKPGPTICGIPAVREGSFQPEIGMTVWLELSRRGPFKVIGKYEHPLGAEIKARRPKDAPNEYEKVRVRDDLWLCEDSKGEVTIFSAGSLTDKEPESWAVRSFGPLAHLGRKAWDRREIALWLALAGTIAKLVLA